jgi:hypothetical protein
MVEYTASAAYDARAVTDFFHRKKNALERLDDYLFRFIPHTLCRADGDAYVRP